MAEENKEKNIKENDKKEEVKENKTAIDKKQEKSNENVKKTEKKEENKKFEPVKEDKSSNAKVKKEKPKKEKAPKEKKEKKGVAIRIIVTVIILLAIIGLIYLAIPSPEKVVNNVFSDLKKGDFQNIEQYVNYNELVEDTGMNTDSETEMTQEEIDKEKLLYEDLEWKIKSVEKEENTATVEVETTNKDYKTIFNNYFQTLIQKVFSNEDLSDEQIENSFVEELQKEDTEKVTTTQTLTLTKQDGKWRLVVDDSLKNAIYPGLEDAINSINNIVG